MIAHLWSQISEYDLQRYYGSFEAFMAEWARKSANINNGIPVPLEILPVGMVLPKANIRILTNAENQVAIGSPAYTLVKWYSVCRWFDTVAQRIRQYLDVRRHISNSNFQLGVNREDICMWDWVLSATGYGFVENRHPGKNGTCERWFDFPSFLKIGFLLQTLIIGIFHQISKSTWIKNYYLQCINGLCDFESWKSEFWKNQIPISGIPIPEIQTSGIPDSGIPIYRNRISAMN